MAAETVYRSNHPRVLEAWLDTQHRYEDWHGRVGDWGRLYPRHHPLQTRWSTSYEVAGLVGKDGTRDDEKPGVGWRRANRGGRDCWVPDKRTNAGKELAKELEALVVKGLGVLPGMPFDAWGNGKRYTHGIDVWDGVVWVSWGCGEELIEKVDGELWERAKMSEWWAAKEKAEEGESGESGTET